MRWCFVLLLLLGFASASVDIISYNTTDRYVFLDSISGSVDLTIKGENYDEDIVLSDGRIVGLGDFLVANGANFDCSPRDCSMGYSALPGGTDKTIPIVSNESKYVGFVLTGNDVVLDSIHFNVKSDFGKEVNPPLTIEFFEKGEWMFSNFSDEFLPENWGCFNPVKRTLGPLVGNSFYCEMIEIARTDSLMVGADVYPKSGPNLTMNVYPESGFGVSWECEFNPETSEGCVLDLDEGEIVEPGKYQVCVGADILTGYNIYEDLTGEFCGFAYDNPGNVVKDYAIFARGVKYANAGEMGVVDFGDKVDYANSFISDRYDGNCSGGCVLPIKISGVNQNFRISNVSLVYTDNSEWRSSNLVHEIKRIPALVNFNGSLDIELLGMIVKGAGEYFAEVSGEDLFRENIRLIPAPLILSVSPLNPPAGVPVTFFANIDFDSNKSLSYEWDFGDGLKSSSILPYVVHSYKELKNHTLTLTVSAGGNLTSKKQFAVDVISPEDAVAVGLKERKSALVKVRASVEGFRDWYMSDLIKILKIDFFEGELDRLSVAANNSFDDEDFRDVAVELYGLNIPVVVGENKFEIPFLMTDLKDVNIAPVVAISGGSGEGKNSDYANPILVWQNENVDVFLRSKEVFVSYWSEEDFDVLSSYAFDVTSKWDGESYFVINKPFEELYFRGDVGARKAGDSTVIVINAGESKSFEFYHEGKTISGFFVSPKLSSLVIEEDISLDCNFNFICDEENGENPDNCRSDCKPVGKAVFYLVVVVLFFLVVYSGLQIWYKRHYEAYLFRDGMQMYNLLMYISNARARGVSDKKIASELRGKGWSGERVDYIIKKSLGKTVGMIEIIPIERISAWLRDKRARDSVALNASQNNFVGQNQGFQGL
jgi:PKD repeat protein